MASNQPEVINRTLLAAADLSDKQFFYIGENGSNKYNVIGNDTLGALGAGFLTNNPLAGEAAFPATVGGGAKGKLFAGVSAGDKLIAKADGTLITKPAGSVGDIFSIVAIALEDGVADDIISLQPVLFTETRHA